jgi:predicted dehydrogenase
MVRIGLIGLGFMGRMHMAAYEKISGAKLVAISDADARRAAGDMSGGWSNVAGAVQKNVDMTQVRGTINWRELINWSDVDVVDICLPTPQHTEVAVAALAAGKHVLCEKPLALNSAAGKQIAEAAATAKGFFMPAMCMRFWPHWKWLREAIAEKRYGKVLSATFRRVATMPPGWFSSGAMSGGAILDLHIHDTDFVNFCFGMPKAVFSRGYSKTSGKTDHIVTQYVYDDVPVVSAEGAWCLAEPFAFSMRYTVNFEKATADFDLAREHPLALHAGGKTEHIDFTGDGYQAELAYFVDCVAKNKRPEIVTVHDAVESLRLIEAEQQSIETGQLVKIS